MSVLTLAQLFVGEVQEVFEHDLEDGALFRLWERVVKVLLGETSHFRRRIKERADPEREDLFQVWTEFALAFANEGSESLMRGFTHFFVPFVHQGSAEMVQEERQQVSKLV